MSTTGRPAAIISKGILEGLEELIHNPTEHLLYKLLHSSTDINSKFVCSNHTFVLFLDPYK
ncbi:hypothetical protein D3C71_1867690 [compost metagenome]